MAVVGAHPHHEYALDERRGKSHVVGGIFTGVCKGYSGKKEIRHAGMPIAIRYDLAQYSIELDWGNSGDGSHQTALAILAYACPDSEALACHEEFVKLVVKKWKRNKNWRIQASTVRRIVEQIQTARQPVTITAKEWWASGHDEWF